MMALMSRPTELIGRKIAELDEDGVFVFDAAVVGPLLGLAPDVFMEELRKGIVYQRHERGTGEDSGRSRVTFRYRARQVVIILDAFGRALDVA
jgi:hypothetical protein